METRPTPEASQIIEQSRSSDETKMATNNKTAVIVVDMQNDYCHDQGALGKIGFKLSQIQSMIPTMQAFLDQARAKGVEVIFTQMTEDPKFLPENLKKKHAASFGSDWKMCTPSTWGYGLTITPKEGEKVFEKNTYDIFSNPNLRLHLETLGITNLIFVGVAAHVCVDTSVRSAVTQGFEVAIATDLVGAPDHIQHLKDSSIATLTTLFASGHHSKDILSTV